MEEALSAKESMENALKAMSPETLDFKDEFDLALKAPKKLGEMRKSSEFIGEANALLKVYKSHYPAFKKQLDLISESKKAEEKVLGGGESSSSKKRLKTK